tara:strand:- start:53 stop:436 length:384 start_codon:yes stop_codon:yes gene_type:complete
MINFITKYLRSKEETYLHERGFKIIERAPVTEDPFPYIILNGKSEEDHTAQYVPSNIVGRQGPRGVVHPSSHQSSKLVEVIEDMAKQGFDLEDGLFDTKPGDKIPLYVLDKSWMPIAQKVVKKYSKN